MDRSFFGPDLGVGTFQSLLYNPDQNLDHDTAGELEHAGARALSSWLWERGKSPYDLFLSNTEENGKCFIWNYPEKVLSGRQKMSRRTVYGNILALTDVLCISDQAGRVGKVIKWSGCMKSCFP